ncbi:AMP-binding protein [Lignipirellula cremea]|uniref:Acetyl-coenzyme A synthetase n=1 Tax=Lignipirellula cremea TaxID=2528010 RepID=A0A518DP47_9BACT|nr:AMP-binding protein [Lignipirellula cremea]QDU93609.1 Acetyl-coenzyme A synthetase [Lignipirellula cremea]
MTNEPADPTADNTASDTWRPTPEMIAASSLAWLMQRAGVADYAALHRWSVEQPAAFWQATVELLGIPFRQPYTELLNLDQGVEQPRWFAGAQMNIVDSCFTAPADSPAIVQQVEGGSLQTVSVGELQSLTGRVTRGLLRRGCQPGDAYAILMPMTIECVAIYLGLIQAGCVVVSIADSFQPQEIRTRLRISSAVGIFTQTHLARGSRRFPLYENAIAAEGPPAIVLPAATPGSMPPLTPGDLLREQDTSWDDFLGDETTADAGDVAAVAADPSTMINILFSSGTTGDPKAIPWSHTTPIKCGADGRFHQNIQPGDVVVWPTNIGWMMGPWLIFASLMNRATMGLFVGSPLGPEFCRFVQDARTTMLGVVPSLVKTWRTGDCVQGLDWSTIKNFSSTGECSRVDDMVWLMQQAGGKPVVEYCGGTEIGGGYVACALVEPCRAGVFNSPTLGIDLVLLNEQGEPADEGEVFLVPPSIGFSTSLLNRDHHATYYADTPTGPQGQTLRRHGDQMIRLADGWQAQGRADDTMNLGGIKVGSAEIERVLQTTPGVQEAAAVAVAPGGGPSQLVIYAVASSVPPGGAAELMQQMQQRIKTELNPLFKIHDLVLVDVMPRTASNKLMRRVLRDQYVNTSRP